MSLWLLYHQEPGGSGEASLLAGSRRLAATPVVSRAVESQNTSVGVGSGTDGVSLSVYVYMLVLGLELGPSIY